MISEEYNFYKEILRKKKEREQYYKILDELDKILEKEKWLKEGKLEMAEKEWDEKCSG